MVEFSGDGPRRGAEVLETLRKNQKKYNRRARRLRNGRIYF
jgi:hypothetical protein